MKTHLAFKKDFGQLHSNVDSRGDLTEIYRATWPGAPLLKQWNMVHNKANVMRGMHAHLMHSDFIIVIDGEMQLGLCDIRLDSANFGARTVISLSGVDLCWAHIRPGILHGFYIPQGCTMVYGLSEGWDMKDEFGCQWNDPDLNLDWPLISDPVLSARDTTLGSYSQLLHQYEELASRER